MNVRELGALMDRLEAQGHGDRDVLVQIESDEFTNTDRDNLALHDWLVSSAEVPDPGDCVVLTAVPDPACLQEP